MRIPKHIGIIPDGNRRWALSKGLSKDKGYLSGIKPGLCLFKDCRNLGINEITFYGFTADNTKRPTLQRLSFTKACVDAVNLLTNEDCEILVVGNDKSKMFPEELKQYITRKKIGKGGIKVNFLINYSPEWDLNLVSINKMPFNSVDISRIDLVVRWGGMCRLSGFLPIQCVYSDFYVVRDLWPDYKKEHLLEALSWYSHQDITLGG